MANRAVEEFASNSTTTVVTDTSSFVNGISGSLVPNGAAAAAFTKRVRFQTPIQATDRLLIEIRNSATAVWIPIEAAPYQNGFQPFVIQNGVDYGIGFVANYVNATDVDVGFGHYGYASAGYGTAGTVWSSMGAVATTYWRVRKVSGGASVGYPIGARNVVGDTTGTAVPVGYIGEMTGTVRSGTGGNSYSVRSTTAVGVGSMTTVISQALNKGTYWVSITVHTINSIANILYAYGTVGSTQVTTQFGNAVVAEAYVVITIAFPVIITADGTSVGASAGVSAGTPSSPNHEMSIVRVG
jgi:hypothetical protein